MIADIITLGRILFSLCMFFLSATSLPFKVLYLLCGVSDIPDGIVARRLNTVSRTGEILDSVADLFFAVAYIVKVLPLLSVPLWIWIWTALIAIIKVTVILIASKKARSLRIEHSFGNKLTGLLLFILPFSICIVRVEFGATLVGVVATITAIKETVHKSNKPKM